MKGGVNCSARAHAHRHASDARARASLYIFSRYAGRAWEYIHAIARNKKTAKVSGFLHLSLCVAQ